MRDLGRQLVMAMAVAAGVAGCSGTSTPPAHPSSSAPIPAVVRPGTTGAVALGDRPFSLRVPRSYAPRQPVPLVIALHGYGGDPDTFATSLSLPQASDTHGFLLATPSGTKDSGGRRFWNATDACCDFNDTAVDDSAYLSSLVTTVARTYAVDPARVFVIGLSNGGFMAHRLACDHAEQIAAVVSIAGAQNADRSRCKPSRAVSVLEVHGTADDTVLFGGGDFAGHAYPSVTETVGDWRALDHCAGRPVTVGAPLDAVASLPGAETVRTSWTSGCARHTAVAVWTVQGGPHVPQYSTAFTDAILSWLEGHRGSSG